MELFFVILNPVFLLISACGMEAVAWWTHKHIMHGLLWSWHEDHHRPLRKGLQKNDRFVLVFSLFNASLYISGSLLSFPTLIWIAAGVTLYGIGYFLFHDVMFHNRLPWMKLKPTTRYLRRIVKAHSVHHQNSGKNNGISFGFLYAPPKYDVG